MEAHCCQLGKNFKLIYSFLAGLNTLPVFIFFPLKQFRPVSSQRQEPACQSRVMPFSNKLLADEEEMSMKFRRTTSATQNATATQARLQLKEAFKVVQEIDKDSSGAIDQNEFQDVLKYLQIQLQDPLNDADTVFGKLGALVSPDLS
eukprot:600231-Hanusia_phi.AAC.8